MGSRPFAMIAGLVVVLDQITKWLVLAKMPLYHSIPVIPGFFNLTISAIPAARSVSWPPAARGSATCFSRRVHLAMGLIVYFYRSTPKTHPYLASALAMIFGGAVGNLIDRLRFGEVVDFLDVYGGLPLAGLQCGRQRHHRGHHDFYRACGTGKNAGIQLIAHR
jgi:signal peptidase II